MTFLTEYGTIGNVAATGGPHHDDRSGLERAGRSKMSTRQESESGAI